MELSTPDPAASVAGIRRPAGEVRTGWHVILPDENRWRLVESAEQAGPVTLLTVAHPDSKPLHSRTESVLRKTRMATRTPGEQIIAVTTIDAQRRAEHTYTEGANR